MFEDPVRVRPLFLTLCVFVVLLLIGLMWFYPRTTSAVEGAPDTVSTDTGFTLGEIAFPPTVYDMNVTYYDDVVFKADVVFGAGVTFEGTVVWVDTTGIKERTWVEDD